VKTSIALLSLPLAFTLSSGCFAKNEIAIGDLMANPKLYEGKEVTLRCTVRSADLASAYCEEGNLSVSLGTRTMDKASAKFVLAKCTKADVQKNDPKCQNATVTAKLKDAKNPRWLDNAKVKVSAK
jgi:hypothetical protein